MYLAGWRACIGSVDNGNCINGRRHLVVVDHGITFSIKLKSSAKIEDKMAMPFQWVFECYFVFAKMPERSNDDEYDDECVHSVHIYRMKTRNRRCSVNNSKVPIIVDDDDNDNSNLQLKKQSFNTHNICIVFII